MLQGILTLGLHHLGAPPHRCDTSTATRSWPATPEVTAQQRRVVFGFIVLRLLTAAYQIAVRTGQDTAVGLFILASRALAPLIWGSAMRFRLGNTRWRGLRLQFTAGWRQVLYGEAGPCSPSPPCGWPRSTGCRRWRGTHGRRLPRTEASPQVTGAMWGNCSR